MHNNTIKVNLFQFKYIDYMSIKIVSVYEVLKSIRKARNSPRRPGILVESTRTLPGIPGFLVGKYQDFTRTPPGILVYNQNYQESFMSGAVESSGSRTWHGFTNPHGYQIQVGWVQIWVDLRSPPENSHLWPGCGRFFLIKLNII